MDTVGKNAKKIEEYIRNQLQEDNVRVPCTDECEKAVNGTGGNSDTGKKSGEGSKNMYSIGRDIITVFSGR